MAFWIKPLLFGLTVISSAGIAGGYLMINSPNQSKELVNNSDSDVEGGSISASHSEKGNQELQGDNQEGRGQTNSEKHTQESEETSENGSDSSKVEVQAQSLQEGNISTSIEKESKGRVEMGNNTYEDFWFSL
ncbi:hypothetical protein [Mycoplasma suis]|uniref:Uncharacterized protein n=2 Tax=Mycoplasma suis (strain Illinois) TaxID=768700 RepID=F0QRL4_MYCSL|nr:hypothetical protein [Mycoplasma suis]ADX98134.1 hypothetical protein MSU_0602 [Mycoplasma suis str. Illinois]